MFKSLGGYLIVTALAAAPLGGQDIERMQRRVDSTFQEAARAQAAVVEYRKAHPLRLDYTDSVITANGKIRVYFDSGFARQVRAGVAEAERYLAELGGALSNAEPIIFSVVPDSAFNSYDRSYGRVRQMNVRRHYAFAPNAPQRTSVEGDPQSIAYVIVRSVAESEGHKAPSRLTSWTNGTLPLAPDLDTKVDWGSMRLAIVSSPSSHGRACFLGEVQSCRIVLGLDTVPNPVQQLFDTAGRRRRVLYEVDRARSFAAVATDRCLSGNDEACIAVLNGMGGVRILSSPYIRSSLVTHALKLGGSRAAERLLTTAGTPGDALAAAAQRPLDSLIADWQRHLSERSGPTTNLPFTIAISSIIWIGVCVFLALRSSRWR